MVQCSWGQKRVFLGRVLLDITRKYELADCWFEEVCGGEEQVAELGYYSNVFDEFKWHVLCSPGISREVRDWVTAPIDYCSHHCPSERPGQEMHPTPIGLLRGMALVHCLQPGWLAVSLCWHTLWIHYCYLTWFCVYFKLFDQWALLSRKSIVMLLFF